MASSSGSRPREKWLTSDGERLVKRRSIALALDTIDCPIFLEPLATPVYQCSNGHMACAECHKKLTKGLCPACSLPVGRNRCIAIEKVIESLRVPCKYAEYGCEEMLQYCVLKRDGHENLCNFVNMHTEDVKMRKRKTVGLGTSSETPTTFSLIENVDIVKVLSWQLDTNFFDPAFTRIQDFLKKVCKPFFSF